jgi:hypothetical protein
MADAHHPPFFQRSAADLLVEGEHLVCGLSQTIATEQHIRVDVVGAEEIADPGTRQSRL